MNINFRVNDTTHEISVDPGLTLLERDLLRVVLDRGLVNRWIDVDVYRNRARHRVLRMSAAKGARLV